MVRHALLALLVLVLLAGAAELGRQTGVREGRFAAQWECRCAQ